MTTTTKPIQNPVVVGDPVVVSKSYGLPGTTGYETAVIFKLRNPGGQDLRRVPFKVTLSDASGSALKATGGDDTVAIRANEERWVVASQGLDVTGTKPATATVTVYSPRRVSGIETDGAQADPSLWHRANGLLNCDTPVTVCEATADLTFVGTEPQRDVTVYVVTHDGDVNGPVVGGGRTTLQQRDIPPNDPIPVKINVTVDEATRRASTTKTKSEAYVESFGQPPAGD
ncbi:MAG: hypothetical protein M3256_27700 [Actinomycetota bacterium]|nr:hypothetical protein [Actinomycetota bacterium]